MKRMLRRAGLVAFLLVPPFFAWGCGPAPTWRAFSIGPQKILIFPGDAEVLAVDPGESDKTPVGRVLDARTGAEKRLIRFPKGATVTGLLPDGGVLVCEKEIGLHLLFSSDSFLSPRMISPPFKPAELDHSHLDGSRRWLLSSWRRQGADGNPVCVVAIHDLQSTSPPRLYEGFGRGSFLMDRRHVVLREESPATPNARATGKPTRQVCFDLATDERKWEAVLPDGYFLFHSAPSKHWVVFRQGTFAAASQQPEFVALDDRTGVKVAEWSGSVRSFSPDGLVVESSSPGGEALVHGDGFSRTFDLGTTRGARHFWLAERHDGQRLLVDDRTEIFDLASLGVKSLAGFDSIQRLQQREWNVGTGELVHSAVQYRFSRYTADWNGFESSDGRFEIQNGELFGFHWIQRVERPSVKNIPVRVAIAVAPAMVVAGLFVLKRVRRRAARIDPVPEESPA